MTTRPQTKQKSSPNSSDDREISRIKSDRAALVKEIEFAGGVVRGKTIRCPFHEKEGSNPSAGIIQKGADFLLSCRGCQWNGDTGTGDIIAVVRRAYNLNFVGALEHLGIGTANQTPKRPSKVFHSVKEYTNSLGASFGGVWHYKTFSIVRINEPDGGKRFMSVRLVNEVLIFSKPPGLLPLYGLDEVLASAGPVFVAEGEKCADALRKLGFTVATSAFGAQSAASSDWAPLAGRDMIILPDNDNPGRGYAHDVARRLSELNHETRVRIVKLPDLPEHGDIVDFIEARDSVESDDIVREIETLVEATPRFNPDNAPPTDSLPEQSGPPWWTPAQLASDPRYRRGLIAVPTGFEVLDEALGGGLRPETLNTLAARTGLGKTTVGVNIALRVSINGHCVLYLKLEETQTEALWRMHAATAHVPLKALIDADPTQDEQAKLDDAWTLLRTLPIRLNDVRTVEAIERVAKAHVEADGKLIVVDQLSQIEVPGAGIGYESVTKASKVLRNLARDLHVPVLLLCQVNRPAAVKKEDLTIHDLRDSGCLENDSAVVMLINKIREPDGPRWSGCELERRMELLVGKNRYGRTTDPDRPIELVWFPRLCRIDEPERAPVEARP